VLGKASIFVVEDEALIRMMLAEMVEELGHRIVAEAGNVKDARALAETIFLTSPFSTSTSPVLALPRSPIIDRRGLPFLFVSGYGSGGRPEAFRSRPALRKPVLLSKLGETINAILATPAGESSPKIQ
jgi:hypothetical protein